MPNKIFKTSLFSAILSFPLFANAAFGETEKLLTSITSLVGKLIPIAFGLAVLFFFWGIVKFIWSVGAGKDEGKRVMFWGVIAIFVISCIWGIVSFIGGSFGIQINTPAPTVPTINYQP